MKNLLLNNSFKLVFCNSNFSKTRLTRLDFVSSSINFSEGIEKAKTRMFIGQRKKKKKRMKGRMKIRERFLSSDDGFTIIDPRTFDFFFLKGKGKILPCKRPIRRSTILCRRREKELRPIGLPSNWNS